MKEATLRYWLADFDQEIENEYDEEYRTAIIDTLKSLLYPPEEHADPFGFVLDGKVYRVFNDDLVWADIFELSQADLYRLDEELGKCWRLQAFEEYDNADELEAELSLIVRPVGAYRTRFSAVVDIDQESIVWTEQGTGKIEILRIYPLEKA